MMIRLGGGDLNALVALCGFALGIGVGVIFLKDVYKRQAVSTAPPPWRPPVVLSSSGKPRAPSQSRRIRPVSYTHLDVYKRQAVELADVLGYDIVWQKRRD